MDLAQNNPECTCGVNHHSNHRLSRSADVQLHHRAGAKSQEGGVSQAAAAATERRGQTHPEQQAEEKVLLANREATLKKNKKAFSSHTHTRKMGLGSSKLKKQIKIYKIYFKINGEKSVPFGQTNPEDKKKKYCTDFIRSDQVLFGRHPTELVVSSWF